MTAVACVTMARTTTPQAAGSYRQLAHVLYTGTEEAVGGSGENESLGSSDDDDEANQLPFPDAESQPTSDEASGQLYENNRKLQEMQKRSLGKKKKFQSLLKAYQRKEMEFVAQMDSHMDEVEHTEHALSLKIEALSAENHQLRTFNEKRERDNSQLAERLGETTKQCSESETRVQFLVDRIVALLSSGSGDPSQTEAVVSMRQREREMLRQLEETRQQFDEVRQQNGELHSRLTEELGLSRRLQEQLVEVEERFSTFQTQRGTDPGIDSSLPGLQSSGFPGMEGSSSLRTGRLGPRPMGLRSDQSEAPPERERQPLPELPPPISEVGEGNEPSQMDGQSTLNPVMEGELAPSSDDEQAAEQQSSGDAAESGGNAEYSMNVPADSPLPSAVPGDAPLETSNNSSTPSSEDSSLTRVQQGSRALPSVFSSSSRVSPRPSPPVKSPVNERPQYSRTTSPEGVALMEQRLREALDRASFECAVVRNESGTYNFGPHVCAVVELTPENEVVACLQESGDWAPIDDFIRSVAQRPAPAGTSSAGSNTAPLALASSWPGPSPVVGNKASPADAAGNSTPGGEPPNERRLFGPPAKAGVSPYGSSQALGTSLSMSGASSSVSSTSPRRVASVIPSTTPLAAAKSAPLAPAKGLQGGSASAPLVQSGGSSSAPVVQAAPPGVLGRRSAGSTPERVRMPLQPSPRPGYPGGQVLASGAAHGASGPQSAGQRMVIAPSAGAASRYGVATLSPGRQMPPTAQVYQQGSSSPRLQG